MGYNNQHQPPIHTEKIQSERKTFFLDLKENDRGRFLKITEDVRGRRDTIIVPIEIIDDFCDALERCAEANDAEDGIVHDEVADDDTGDDRD